MGQESVIAALEQAVVAAPDDVDVRVHLAGLYVENSEPGLALEHVRAALTHQPDHAVGLQVACQAARMSGMHDLADRYARMRDALPGDPVDDSQSSRDAVATPETVEDLLNSWEAIPAPAEPVVGSVSRPIVRLADVAGLEPVKERLESSFLGPIQHPELQAAFGKAAGGGLLLWGPPGCGKTYVARALAGELGARFYEVGLADVLDMWIGSSERNLASLFDVARRNTPCVLFFDEVEALGQKRTNLRHAAALRGTVNQFLLELDGVSRSNEGIFVLGATNHPWDLDAALRRPGRFDRSVFVLPPDTEARAAIFQARLADRPTEPAIDFLRLAAATRGMSGADIALVCDDATEMAMAASARTGSIQPITQRILLKCAKATRSSISEWLETARNYAVYSNEAGAYDELLDYLKGPRS